jgi:hypothetical protein
LAIPFGSVEDKQLWQVISAVESKKHGYLKVIQSADQVLLRKVWKDSADDPELSHVHASLCTCEACLQAKAKEMQKKKINRKTPLNPLIKGL